MNNGPRGYVYDQDNVVVARTDDEVSVIVCEFVVAGHMHVCVSRQECQYADVKHDNGV